MTVRGAIFALCALAVTVPADAHKLREPGLPEKVADGAFVATPGKLWNRLQQSEGKFQEVWTIDGHKLNRLAFYGGVPAGEPLLKERHKKRDPLPKVSKNMLLPDIPTLLERTYRTQYGVPIFEVGKQEPAEIGGKAGIHFEYSYLDPEDEVERRGEAYAALEGGKLYLVTFEAPGLFYFEREAGEFRTLVKSLELRR